MLYKVGFMVITEKKQINFNAMSFAIENKVNETILEHICIEHGNLILV